MDELAALKLKLPVCTHSANSQQSLNWTFSCSIHGKRNKSKSSLFSWLVSRVDRFARNHFQLKGDRDESQLDISLAFRAQESTQSASFSKASGGLDDVAPKITLMFMFH
jgi:hypothetical protein